LRFLADENFPGAAVTALREAGHDVSWVLSLSPGLPDIEVLAWARREDRVLLTFDKDFGELARSAATPLTCGIMLFRIPMPRAAEIGERFVALIASRDDWAGQFSVVEPGRVRMRPLE
jgi:Domain of unknown function (DUF5615)